MHLGYFDNYIREECDDRQDTAGREMIEKRLDQLMAKWPRKSTPKSSTPRRGLEGVMEWYEEQVAASKLFAYRDTYGTVAEAPSSAQDPSKQFRGLCSTLS